MGLKLVTHILTHTLFRPQFVLGFLNLSTVGLKFIKHILTHMHAFQIFEPAVFPCWTALELRLECSGMLWDCFGNALGMVLECSWNALGELLECSGIALGVLLECFGGVVEVGRILSLSAKSLT